jgi:hypothetical protein
VDLTAALTADLAALSRALDEPDVDLETLLQAVTADLEKAVDSYLGLAMTIALNGHELTLTTYNRAQAQITSSLLLPLGAVSGAQAGSNLVLYAATPGAFVDLAADLNFALGLDPSAVVLDHHLTAPTGTDGIDGLQPWIDINRAVGVLIGRGHTPESAQAELHHLAMMHSDNLHHAAAIILASTRGSPASDNDQPPCNPS